MDSLNAFFIHYWPHIALVIGVVAGTGAAIHAAMTKQDMRAAIGWVGMTLFSPLFGAFLYFVAGINSIPQIRVSQQRDEAAQLFTGNDDPRVTDVAPYSAPNFPH